MQKLFGLGLVVICVFGGFVMAKGRLIALWQPAEMLIILGAGLGALFIGNSRAVLSETGRQLKAMIRARKDERELYPELLRLMYQLLELARSKGLKALDEHVEAPFESPLFTQYPAVMAQPLLVSFIVDNLRMLGMGRMTVHEFEGLLEQEIAAIEEDLLKPSRAMHRVADAMPGFGILAAVGGVIITMQHLDGPLVSIGVHVAAALVGTFIGIFCCYCLFEPASSALAEQVGRRISQLDCVKAILAAHVSGKTPLLAVDAGRKTLEIDAKPSFATLESWVGALVPAADAGGTMAEEAAGAVPMDNVAPMPRRRSTDR